MSHPIEGMVLRFQPKGSMCASCAKQSADCTDLPFFEMLPILDKYTDQTGEKPVSVLIVKCKEYHRLH